jgi:hypothetical protein
MFQYYSEKALSCQYANTNVNLRCIIYYLRTVNSDDSFERDYRIIIIRTQRFGWASKYLFDVCGGDNKRSFCILCFFVLCIVVQLRNVNQ